MQPSSATARQANYRLKNDANASTALLLKGKIVHCPGRSAVPAWRTLGLFIHAAFCPARHADPRRRTAARRRCGGGRVLRKIGAAALHRTLLGLPRREETVV